MTESEKVVKVLKEDLPALVKLLKEKFSGTTSKTFKTADGDLIHEGELAAGVDVFLMEADKKIPAPTKTYKATDGTEVVVEAGKVVDLKKPATASKEADFKAIVDEIFKALPKIDLAKFENTLSELKTQLGTVSEENKLMKAAIEKNDAFKKEVLDILGQFAKQPEAEATDKKKNSSVKTIFSAELTPAERVKILQETKI